MRICSYFFFVSFVFACSGTPSPTPALVEKKVATASIPKTKTPSRTLLFIGDGMGVGAITGTAYVADKKLQMLSMPEFGWMSTHSHEFVTTDSAASASAMATGQKTHFNGVSVTPGTTIENETQTERHFETFFEIAQKKGLGRGIVSTSRVNHATPAAFYAHRSYRRSYEKIAEDLVDAELDVVLGAGWKYFRARKDGQDLIAKIKNAGYDYFETPTELKKFTKESKKAMGLFYEGDMPFMVDEERVVSLPQMVNSAIEILDRGHPEGWVLMVEGSFIDWCAHAMRAKCTLTETKDFDDAIAVGRAYAKSRVENDTLIVATADHETGGLSIIDPPLAKRFSDRIDAKTMKTRPIDAFKVGAYFTPFLKALDQPKLVTAFGSMSTASKMVWAKEGRFYAAHTANFVPIFAEGPSSQYVTGSRDNATLGHRLKEIIGSAQFKEEVRSNKDPENIVLFIGDGMGIPAVTLGYYAEGKSNMLSLTEHGIVATQSSTALVPDAAATASALATGHLNEPGEVIENPETIIERAAKSGKSIGIITTAGITEDTPAAFYGHQETHRSPDAVMNDLLNFKTKNGKNIDLLLGGGFKHISALNKVLEDQGYEISQTWPPKTTGPIIGAFSPGVLPNMTQRTSKNTTIPTLSEMVDFAINLLSKNEKGFVLVVESGQIDSLTSELRNSELVPEIAEFEKAINLAEQKVDAETLIVVTADHAHTTSILDNHYAFESGRCGAAKRCGGKLEFADQEVTFPKSDLQGEYIPRVILQHAWIVRSAQNPKSAKERIIESNSANFVPLFAKGPGADSLRGFSTQAEIGKRLKGFVNPP